MTTAPESIPQKPSKNESSSAEKRLNPDVARLPKAKVRNDDSDAIEARLYDARGSCGADLSIAHVE